MNQLLSFLAVGLVTMGIAHSAPFKEELYQIYEEIYQKRAPHLNVDIDFINYEEQGNEAEYDWQASFYLKRDQSGVEERLGYKIIELGRVELPAKELSLFSWKKPAKKIHFNSQFNLRFYNQLGDLSVFDFSFLEDVELKGIIDREAFTFHQDGAIREQESPIVIDGLNYGSIKFNQFLVESDYQFAPQFTELMGKKNRYKIEDLVADTFSYEKEFPLLITVGELEEWTDHDYAQNNYHYNLHLNNLAYSDAKRHFEMDRIDQHYRLESEENRIDTIRFDTKFHQIRMHDGRCSAGNICQLGDIALSVKMRHFESIDYDQFAKGLKRFKQFLTAESFYALTAFDLQAQLGELSYLLGDLISERSDLQVDLSFATKGKASATLYLKPTKALSDDLKAMKSKNASVCRLTIDQCFDRYIDQLDLSITLSDRYFYDAYSLFLMALDSEMDEARARKKARVMIRNLMLANLFFSATDLTLLERENEGISIDIHYKNNAWIINGKRLDTKQLTEIGF